MTFFLWELDFEGLDGPVSGFVSSFGSHFHGNRNCCFFGLVREHQQCKKFEVNRLEFDIFSEDIYIEKISFDLVVFLLFLSKCVTR